jgi:hypothetical protein
VGKEEERLYHRINLWKKLREKKIWRKLLIILTPLKYKKLFSWGAFVKVEN